MNLERSISGKDSSIDQIKFDETKAQEDFNFILKLANDIDLPDEQIIEGIVANLKKVEPSRNLPNMIDVLSPASYHSETKLMTEKQKARLDKALTQWQESIGK